MTFTNTTETHSVPVISFLETAIAYAISVSIGFSLSVCVFPLDLKSLSADLSEIWYVGRYAEHLVPSKKTDM